jgi:hypothetical protein
MNYGNKLQESHDNDNDSDYDKFEPISPYPNSTVELLLDISKERIKTFEKECWTLSYRCLEEMIDKFGKMSTATEEPGKEYYTISIMSDRDLNNTDTATYMLNDIMKEDNLLPYNKLLDWQQLVYNMLQQRGHWFEMKKDSMMTYEYPEILVEGHTDDPKSAEIRAKFISRYMHCAVQVKKVRPAVRKDKSTNMECTVYSFLRHCIYFNGKKITVINSPEEIQSYTEYL